MLLSKVDLPELLMLGEGCKDLWEFANMDNLLQATSGLLEQVKAKLVH